MRNNCQAPIVSLGALPAIPSRPSPTETPMDLSFTPEEQAFREEVRARPLARRSLPVAGS